MADVSEKQYQKMSKKASPKSPSVTNCIKAFLVGGLICALGELIVQTAQQTLGMDEQQARSLCSLCLIFLSILLTGLNVYDNIAKHAGAGTLVPITGFANAIASPAIEYKSEGLITGLAVKMFTIAGPVLVYGIGASVLYGIVYYIVTLFVK